MLKSLALFIFLFTGPSMVLAQADSVIIKSIYFGGGSYYVDDYQTLELYELIDRLGDLGAYQISITSHTDNIGGAEFNEWLSRMRSEAVIEKLLLKNIPIEQIFIKDFGQDNPLYSNQNWGGRLKNRRVDIIFSPMIL